MLSAECGIGGERLGVDADRPVGRLDYRFVVVGSRMQRLRVPA